MIYIEVNAVSSIPYIVFSQLFQRERKLKSKIDKVNKLPPPKNASKERKVCLLNSRTTIPK